jgi:glycosyltransferase involved in cell wall biosynthesis
MTDPLEAQSLWSPWQGPIEVLTSSKPNATATQTAALRHVLLVLDQFPETLGGGETIVLRMARLLPAFGFRVSILTFLVHPKSSVLRDAPPCPIYLLPLTKTYDAKAFRAAFALGRFLRKENVRVVQTFFESADLWAGLVVKAFSDAKLIWSRRDMGILRQRKHQVAYRWLAKLPDLVFAVSEQVRRHCIEVDGISPDRVETIYNGLDIPEEFTPNAPHDPASDFAVITVGNIRRVKGFDILVEAAAIVLKSVPNVHFSIAGGILEPLYFAQLEQAIERLSLSENVHFLGSLTDLRPVLQKSDLFVLPSRSEGFSNAILEAMAFSLPIVATRVGGNDEAVQDNVTGYIVPPEDAVALASAILRVITSSTNANETGVRGRMRVSEKFTTHAMMARTVTLYNHLLS